jgi:hypothetical protein
MEYVLSYPPDFPLASGDRLICSLGEIDCRAHVVRIVAKKGISADEVLDDLVERYIATLRDLVEHCGLDVWISCVVPPSRRSNLSEVAIREQAYLRRSLNAKLAAQSSVAKLGFLDFYDHLAGPDGVLPDALAIDDFHVHPRRVGAILKVVATELDMRLSRRWILGEAKRYGGHMSWARRARKLVTDAPLMLVRALRPHQR